MVPMLTTEGVAEMLVWRLITVCKPMMDRALTVIGSIPCQGAPAWVCLPMILIRRSSELAMVGPGR